MLDVFLHLDGIKGESADAKHKDEMHIETFTFCLDHAPAGVGKVKVHDIRLTKKIDKSSPGLFSACASGERIKEGRLTVRKAGEKPLEYIKFKLSDVLVSSYQVGHADGEEIPTDSFTLSCAKFQIEYQEQKADGSGVPGGQMGWDVKANANF